MLDVAAQNEPLIDRLKLMTRNFFADALESALRELPKTDLPAALMFFDIDRRERVCPVHDGP